VLLQGSVHYGQFGVDWVQQDGPLLNTERKVQGAATPDGVKQRL
jgi:hypothetical protein